MGHNIHLLLPCFLPLQSPSLRTLIMKNKERVNLLKVFAASYRKRRIRNFLGTYSHTPQTRTFILSYALRQRYQHNTRLFFDEEYAIHSPRINLQSG